MSRDHPEGDAQSRPLRPFPFSTKSVLEMCWGITLSLSHEPQQQEVGKMFSDQFGRIFEWGEKNPRDVDFLQNLTMALSGAVRNIGFVRDNHVQYLVFMADGLTRRRQNLEQIADFASFSGSGLFAKIGSFAGFGSVADLVTKLNYPQNDIPIFVAVGIAGAFLVTLGVRLYTNHTDDSWVANITKKQNGYWREKFKPGMRDELFHLCLDVKALIEKFYPDDWHAIESNDALLRMPDEEIKKLISDQILHPDNLVWPPYIAPKEETQKDRGGQTEKPQGEGTAGSNGAGGEQQPGGPKP